MKILLAVDDSKFSKAATRILIAQARPQNDEVRVLHVVDIFNLQIPDGIGYYPGVEHCRDAQRKPAEALVARTAELFRSRNLQVTTALEWGDPKSKIIDTAAEWHADLIVLGSHGRIGLERFLMGSVPDAVMRHAHCSVELVRIPPATKGSKPVVGLKDGKIRRILLAIDDSKFSEAATRLLIEQTRPNETEVRVLHVVEPPQLLVARERGGYDSAMERVWEDQIKQAQALVASTEEKVRAKGVKVSTAVEQGYAKSKILDMAGRWRADLIVMGSHGRKGLSRFFMGEVSEVVARHARCSVEVVRICP